MRPDLEEGLSEAQVRSEGAVLVLDEGHDVEGADVRVHEDGGGVTEEVVRRETVDAGLQAVRADHGLRGSVGSGEHRVCEAARHERKEHGEEEPERDRGECRGRGMA